MSMGTEDGFALDMTGVSKRFGHTLVLDGVTFRVRPGTVHGLVGHNGAGKSTLMKIALGGVEPTTGTVAIGGTQLSYSRPAEAREAGVGMVLQELSLIPTLSVADNIFLNAEKTRWLGTIASRAQHREAAALLRDLGITSVRPGQTVGELGIAEQQMVEIAKALRLTRQLLILDEPTAPLSRREVERLFELVRRAAGMGVGVVFITHHLREVFEVCDEITVLRGGRVVLTSAVTATTLRAVVAAIVGSELAAIEDHEEARSLVEHAAEPILVVTDLRVPGKLEHVSFELRPGEVVGVAGLAGSGRTTLLKTLFGEVRPESGSATLNGRDYRPGNPGAAIRAGVFLIPEDRRVHGLVLMHSIEQNAVLSILRRVSPGYLYRPDVARRETVDMIRLLDVRTTGPGQATSELSGGNQQKVVLAKAMAAEPQVFLLDEPTFGVDVQTAAAIIEHVRDLVRAGKAAIWVSSDIAELLHVADRVLVLADGTIKTEVQRGSPGFTEDALLHAIQRAGGDRVPDAAAGAAP
jgi:ribose transport system ATP-binding protein